MKTKEVGLWTRPTSIGTMMIITTNYTSISSLTIGFRQNNKLADEVAMFTDENFWMLNPKCRDIFRRIPYDTPENQAKQKCGIDIEVGRMKIDEKVKVKNCLNIPLEKTSFELFHHGPKLGWFLKPESETTHYAFITLSCQTGIGENEVAHDNITTADYCLVQKEGFVRHLEEHYGITMESLEDDARLFYLKKNAGSFAVREYAPINGDGHTLYLTFSRFSENGRRTNATNLVFYMEDLRRLPFVRTIRIARRNWKQICN